VNKLRTRELWVLVPLVAKQVVSAGEAIYIRAAGYGAVKDSFRRQRSRMSGLVTIEVLGIEETLSTDGALVRPLRASQMLLLVTSRGRLAWGS
jgi:hypothetical protein